MSNNLIVAHQKLIIKDDGEMAALVQGSGARFGDGWKLVDGGGVTSGSEGDWMPVGSEFSEAAS